MIDSHMIESMDLSLNIFCDGKLATSRHNLFQGWGTLNSCTPFVITNGWNVLEEAFTSLTDEAGFKTPFQNYNCPNEGVSHY